jgi:SOS-response transcriptional repressor LexA
MNGIEPGGPDGPLSNQRQKILRFVRRFTQREGYPPTLREIGQAVGLAPSSVHYHLSVLQDAGYLTRGAGRPRTAVEAGSPAVGPGPPSSATTPTRPPPSAPTCTGSPSSSAEPTAKNSSASRRHDRQHRHSALT